MRQPARQKGQTPQARVSAVQSYPPPVGGWNARDALADMSPVDAVALENWFPYSSYVEIRGGYADHATAMGEAGKTLAVYNGIDGTNEMFCFTDAATYDVTSAGAVGASVLSRTDGRHVWVNFGDGTNQYLIAVNGVDKPAYYNGTTWVAVDGVSTPALTGLTTTKITSVEVFKGRLIFLEDDTLSFWYLAANAAGGALTEFPLDSFCKKGGYLLAVATWTVDAGSGPDDRCVFITSEGEIIVYAGTDPSSANSWALIGVYSVGSPIGRRCVDRYGADLLLIIESGVFPLTAVLQSAAVDPEDALSYKIEPEFVTAARSYQSNYGWRIFTYPGRSAMFVNIPKAVGGEHEQYVMNTVTSAWCKFLEWDAEDFAILNEELYYTTSSKVVKAWTGQIDGTDNIVAYGKTAFSYFKSPGVQKHVNMFRPVLAVNGTLEFLIDVDVDFQDGEITGTATYSTTTGAKWDEDKWDEGYWAAGLEIIKEWGAPAEWEGYAISGKLKIQTNSLKVQWMANDYVYERGGVL